jgi:DNA-binding NarL/FixJ family response regulator
MSRSSEARHALVVETSPRWRALVAETLREAGWTVTAVPEPPASLSHPPYRLAVIEAGSAATWPAASLLLDSLAASATVCILLASVPVPELPEALRTHARVVGILNKRSYEREALLSLAAGAISAPAATPTVSGGAHVLVVEDDVQWREIYAELLAEAGLSPYFAVSYGEARGWLQRIEFVLAIVDLNLASSAAPEGNRDGFHLLRATRQRGIRAIVVSALGDPADIDRAYDEFDLFAFVEKEGFDRRNFLRLLDEAQRIPPLAEAGQGADAGPAAHIEQLTPREREVLALLIQGHTNRQIAEALLISPNTTKKHVDHILQKLGASTRAGAVAAALRSSN